MTIGFGGDYIDTTRLPRRPRNGSATQRPLDPHFREVHDLGTRRDAGVDRRHHGPGRRPLADGAARDRFDRSSQYLGNKFYRGEFNSAAGAGIGCPVRWRKPVGRTESVRGRDGRCER